MATSSWKVGRVPVRSFPGKSTAHRHVCEHFFNKAERWEQLSPEHHPGPLAASWQQASTLEEKNRALDLASLPYEAAIRRETSGERSIRVAEYLYKETYGHQVKNRIGVVGQAGLFASFARDSVSVLRTAFRPLPRSLRGPLRQRDYVNGAHIKLSDYLATSELYRKS